MNFPISWWRRRWLFPVILGAGVSAFWIFLRPVSSDPYHLLDNVFLEPVVGGARASDVSRMPRAEVLSVVDGDTIRIRWKGVEERLRFYGVDTPERDEACFEEATLRTIELTGREVRLAFDSRSRDKYGRLLAYIFTNEGVSIDGALVAEGLGRAWTRDGRWRDAMEALETEARGAHCGCLWSSP